MKFVRRIFSVGFRLGSQRESEAIYLGLDFAPEISRESIDAAGGFECVDGMTAEEIAARYRVQRFEPVTRFQSKALRRMGIR